MTKEVVLQWLAIELKWSTAELEGFYIGLEGLDGTDLVLDGCLSAKRVVQVTGYTSYGCHAYKS